MMMMRMMMMFVPCSRAQLDNITHKTTTTSAHRPPTVTVHDNNITISAFHVTHKDTRSYVRSIFKGLTLQAFEDGPDRGVRNVGQYKTDAGETPKN
jgi:hypothetical protein